MNWREKSGRIDHTRYSANRQAMAEFSLAPRLPSAWVRISQRSDIELLIICSKFVAVVPASNWRRSGEHMFKIDGLVKCCVILVCTLSRWVFLPGWEGVHCLHRPNKG